MEKATTLIQGCSVEYGVTISTDAADWANADIENVDTPIVGIRFQLGKDEWTDRYVMPVFGSVAMMTSLIHQLLDAGHDDLALELLREADGKAEQGSVLSLLTSGANKNRLYEELTFPKDEPTLDLIKAATALIQQTINDQREEVSENIETIDIAGGLPSVSRFIALMAGRAIGYISLITEMSPDTIMNILAGAALFESDGNDS
jgi:hypothetical protein